MSQRRGPQRTRGWTTDMDTTIREHFVYRVYDAAGSLLYVGRTKRPNLRWAEHIKSGAPWVTAAARFRVVGPLPYAPAHQLEQRVIRTERPLHNIYGLRGGFTPWATGNGGSGHPPDPFFGATA